MEPPQGVFRDDTALNGIQLLCNEKGVITSSEGLWGSWLPARGCPRSSRLTSFRLRVEPPRGGFRDDTAANDASFMCSDGTVLDGGGGARGQWGNWSQPCPTHVGICGIRTRVEAPQRSQDDTGLNDAAMVCCTQ
ncbi:vitelline membrane outer layer protein 1 homolog [Coturnix japonica]|uniref:vitelline membrane outer layer protein 1 homolog n=1 Tax=Coturnix japonica TaxID=93934 RepID=UPI000776AF45|nr:vitelline membrane outer layer protein 1 homolog [Coturnix japonica]